VWKSKFYGEFVLNPRVDGVAMPVPRRSTEPGRPRQNEYLSAESSSRNDFVHPTHWLISTQVLMRTDSWKCPTGDDRTWMFYDSGGASNKHNYCNPRMRGMEWGLVVLVFVLLWGLGPYTLYYANIMLRVPPFVDDDDYDVITQIVVMSALRSFDKDGNKFLDAEEVKAIVQKLEPGLTDDEIDALIKEADEDGDGHIVPRPRPCFEIFLTRNPVAGLRGVLKNPPQQGRRRPRAGASDQGQAQDRNARQEGRPAGRVRRREQGLGALRLSLPPARRQSQRPRVLVSPS
jgi:hypothetical protein